MASPRQESVVLKEYRPLTHILQKIPRKAQCGLLNVVDIHLTCIDVDSQFIALGSNVGVVFLYDRQKQNITRLKSETYKQTATCVKIHTGLNVQVAFATDKGHIEIFQLPSKLVGHSKQLERFSITDIHSSKVTCLQWSTNGQKLFSGDSSGVVVSTDVDFLQSLCKSEELLQEEIEVVQLDYSFRSLLISTLLRTVICLTDQGNHIVQVGTKERRCLGNFGACFAPGAMNLNDVLLYASRPGLRIWEANRYGVVQSTYIFKDTINEPQTSIPLLKEEQETTPISACKFAKLGIFSEDQLISWNSSHICVLYPAQNIVIATQSRLGHIIDVGITNNEAFILRRNCDPALIRIASDVEPYIQDLAPYSLSHKSQGPLLGPTESFARDILLSSVIHADDLKRNESPLKYLQKNVFGKFMNSSNDSSTSPLRIQIKIPTPPLPRHFRPISSDQDEEMTEQDEISNVSDSQQIITTVASKADHQDVLFDLPPVMPLDPNHMTNLTLKPQSNDAPVVVGADEMLSNNMNSSPAFTHVKSENITPVQKVRGIGAADRFAQISLVDDCSDIVFKPSHKKVKKKRNEKTKKGTSIERHVDVVEHQSDVDKDSQGLRIETETFMNQTNISEDCNHGSNAEHELTSDSQSLSANLLGDDAHTGIFQTLKSPNEEVSIYKDEVSVDLPDNRVEQIKSPVIVNSESEMVVMQSEMIEKTDEICDHLEIPHVEANTTNVYQFNELDQKYVDLSRQCSNLEWQLGNEHVDNVNVRISDGDVDLKPEDKIQQVDNVSHYRGIAEIIDSKHPVDNTTADKIVVDDYSTAGLDKVAADDIYSNARLDKVAADDIYSNARLDKLAADDIYSNARLEKVAADDIYSNARFDKAAADDISSNARLDKVAADDIYSNARLDKIAADDISSNCQPDKIVDNDIYSNARPGKIIVEDLPLTSKPENISEPCDQQVFDIYRNSSSRKSSITSPPMSPASVTEPDMSEQADDIEEVEQFSTQDDFEVFTAQFDKSDTWADFPVPANIQSMSLSSRHIWVTDKNERLFFSGLPGLALSWSKVDAMAKQVSVSPSGQIVWMLYKDSAYAALNVSKRRPVGTKWAEVAREVSFISVDDNCAWYIKHNGEIRFQKNLTRERPMTKSYTIPCSYRLIQISCRNGIMWALTDKYQLIARVGNTSKCPEGIDWLLEKQEGLHFSTIMPGDDSIGWGVDYIGNLRFCCDVSTGFPLGDRKWWQVQVSPYMIESSNQTTAIEKVKSLAGMFDTQRLTSWLKMQESHLLCASRHSVWLSHGNKHRLQMCRGAITGHLWKNVELSGIASSARWRLVCATRANMPNGMIWTQQPNGDIFAFPAHQARFSVVQPPYESCIFTTISMCKTSVWCLTWDGHIYIRNGVNSRTPFGTDWTQLDISQLGDVVFVHLSCGTHNVWAVDEDSVVYHRIGTGASKHLRVNPAWVPIDCQGIDITQIYSSNNDWMVWGIDKRKHVYVRMGITDIMPIGTEWVLVPGIQASMLSVSQTDVWALTPNCDIFFRHGIYPSNPVGDYWRQIPGSPAKISVSVLNELWGINKDGQLICRSITSIHSNPVEESSSQNVDKLLATSTPSLEENDWELIA